MRIFFKLLGSLVFGLLLLVFLPLAWLSGLLMQLPMRKVARAALGIGAALFATHELALLLDMDKAKARARLAEIIQAPGRLLERHRDPTPEAKREGQLVTALRSMGYTAAQAKEMAWATVTRLPTAELSELIKAALSQKAAA